MSYPLLRISEDNRHVEVRKGRGAQRWEDMVEIFNGAATKDQEWSGGEGEKRDRSVVESSAHRIVTVSGALERSSSGVMCSSLSAADAVSPSMQETLTF